MTRISQGHCEDLMGVLDVTRPGALLEGSVSGQADTGEAGEGFGQGQGILHVWAAKKTAHVPPRDRALGTCS